jgi:hypothetical protein
MESILTKEQIAELYCREDERGQKLLRSIFRQEDIQEAMQGVWCARIDDRAQKLTLISKSNCDRYNESWFAGVAIITPIHAFIIASHNTVFAEWGPDSAEWDSDKDDKSTIQLITDESSFDSYTATKCILDHYKGRSTRYSEKGEPFNFTGSPAADFCHRYWGFGEKWTLPTVAQLKIIAEHIKEVQACFVAMKAPVMIDAFYWSSIACHRDFERACAVSMSSGVMRYFYKLEAKCVRAVQPFDISDVCITLLSSAE